MCIVSASICFYVTIEIRGYLSDGDMKSINCCFSMKPTVDL